MRKSFLTFIILLFGCELLAGCGSRKAASADAPEPVREEAVEQVILTETPEQETAEPEGQETPGQEVTEPEEQLISDHKNNYYIHMFDSYEDLLCLYKEAQDRHYTDEQIELIFGYGEALLQYGWPDETSSYDVGYIYHDVNDDGSDEMILTFDNEIVEIYSYFGKKVKRFFSARYGDEITLYPGGILKKYAPETSDFPGTIWYSYDAGLGEYFADFEESYGEYYVFCHYDFSGPERDALEARLREDPDADMPVWIYEFEDMITKSDYQKLLPKSKPIKLPAGEKLADIELPDDYTPRYEAQEGYEDETIPEYLIYVKSPDGYANLRKGPGTEYDVICQIPTGESMEVYRESATDQKGKKWLKVAYWHPDGISQSDGSDDPGTWETGWISESQVE